MAQCLTVAELAQDLGSIPTTNILAHNHHYFSSNEFRILFWPLWAICMNKHQVHFQMREKYSFHIKNK